MTENTKYWDQLKRVPPDQLKGFVRAGGFKGTAIKPMWTIHRMTEIFGLCGKSWGIDRPSFQVVPAGEEMMVYCTVGVWTGSHDPDSGRAFGVGGDKVLLKGRDGLRSDDEAFKKAYTDALTNACKMLGAGADIHMGLWDGNKYVDETPEEKSSNGGTAGASKAQNRGEYSRLSAGIREIAKSGTLEDLRLYIKANSEGINALPRDWFDHLKQEKLDAEKELTS